MFFKQNVFERLLKEAYKTCGIYINHRIDQEECGAYQIAGTDWAAQIQDDEMTKEAKAAVIKLCGDLPEPGEAFLARKDYPNQYEIESAYGNLKEELEECKIKMRITKLLEQRGGSLIRFLQAEGFYTVGINQMIVDLVDKNAVNRDEGEEEPKGPLMRPGDPIHVYWGNEESCLRATVMLPEEEETGFWAELNKARIV